MKQSQPTLLLLCTLSFLCADTLLFADWDFGDATSIPGVSGFPTALVDNGARHASGGPWLGNGSDAPDLEPDALISGLADGDDILDGNDDEDGVLLPSVMYLGLPASIQVEVSGGGGYVDAWIDWGYDFSWDTGDQIHSAWLPDGIHSISVTPPAGGIAAGPTLVRFRISSTGGLLSTGQADDGEVEDHTVDIQGAPESDLGDAPDSTNSYGIGMFAYPGITANYPTVFAAGSPSYGPIHLSPLSTVWLGPNVTLEDEADIGPDQDVVNNIDPNSVPDLDGADDGLHRPVRMPRCKWANVDYDVNISDTTQTYYVNIWCDFNRDGDWDDQVPGCVRGDVPEWAVRNQMLLGLPAGLNTVRSLPFVSWHPANGPDRLWMRISISEQPWQEIWGAGGCGPTSGYAVGETEDYLILPDTSCVECADLNCSGLVDLSDFAIFASQWLGTCP